MLTRFSGRTAAVLAGAAAVIGFAAAPASAQQGIVYIQAPPNLRIERVSYWDLNLASPAGEQILRRRVEGAISDVCLEDHGRWYGLSDPDYTHCVAGAWSRARPQIVGAVYRARQLAYYQGYYRGYRPAYYPRY
jgi:UrcA family protein